MLSVGSSMSTGTDSKIFGSLCPYLDCGVLHVDGRLKESKVVNTNSIIIPVNHPIAKVIKR